MEIGKQKSKGILVVIIILSLVIVGLAGYIAYDKGVFNGKKENSQAAESKQEKNKVETKEVEEKNNDKEQIVKDYVLTLLEPISTRDLMYEKDSIKAEDLTSSQRNDIAFNYLLMSMEYPIVKDVDYISETTLENIYKKYFGENIKYVPTDLHYFNGISYSYEYSSKYHAYELSNDSIGGDGIWFGYNSYLSDYSLNNGNLDIYVYISYFASEGYTEDGKIVYKYYKNSKDKNLITKKSIDASSQDRSGSLGEEYKKYTDKLDKYKYTFVRDSKTNNYNFSKVEKVNK